MELCLSKISCIKALGFYSDPAIAIRAFDELDYVDFLFVDVRMPISGIEVASRIRDQVRFLIFLTAYPEFALDAFSVSADHYLVKPVSLEAIEEAIERVMKREGLTCRKD